jgi:hypothetical protein
VSQILDEVNASGGNVAYIRTLELKCTAWPSSLYVRDGFRDTVLGTEDGRTLLFRAINLGISLPSKDNKGAQTLNFATDNTMGDVSMLTDLAVEANATVTAIYRTYLSTNLAAPAERPYRMVVLSGELQGVIANLQCGFFNILLTAYPRRYLTPDFAPGLRYIV